MHCYCSQKLKSGTSITDITGYSRTRQEFETEWDNDAEQTIADLEFSPDDSEEDRAGKLRLMEIYNLRLDEVSLVAGEGEAGHV